MIGNISKSKGFKGDPGDALRFEDLSKQDKEAFIENIKQELDNSGYITEEDVPTKISQLENDNLYITETQFNHQNLIFVQQNLQFAQNISNLEQQFEQQNSQIDSRFTDVNNQIAGVRIDIETAKAVAYGRTFAIAYNNYKELVDWFNSHDRPNVYPPFGDIKIGQNIYILTLNVPDLWISSVEDDWVTYDYDYTTDEAFNEAFINELNTNGFVRIGKFKFSALETQKVDLTDYATKEEVGDIETALDHIIAIQNEMIGGDTE